MGVKIYTIADCDGKAGNLLDSGSFQRFDPDKQNNEGWTALMYAANYGHENIARLLVENKASLSMTNQAGYTALYYAQQAQREELAQYLLANGAKPLY
jgi:ankyrin repeat protein